MDANLLKYDVSCEFFTVELTPSDFNSITFFINLSPRKVQNPPLCDHHGLPEMAKPSFKCLKPVREKMGWLLSCCCKGLEADESIGIGAHRCKIPSKIGFHSRTSAIDRDERIREAIMYCKSTITGDSSWHEERSH